MSELAADPISFARGAPSADILPVDAVRTAAGRALKEDWEQALSYGGGGGHAGLREWIADRHGHLDPEQVMITNGSLEGSAMLFEQLIGPDDWVVVEQPSYDRTLLLLERLAGRRVGIELDENGIDVGLLEQVLGEGHRPGFVHVIPNFHNPAGCTLSLERRRRLVELAAEHELWIFEDDPYREIGFEGQPLPTMLSMDEADRVIYTSSFSKSISPGVRVGYLAGPVEQIARLSKRANETYISPNMLAESIVHELCRSGGLDENLAVVCGALAERRDTLVAALGAHLPEARFIVPAGGYFLWLTLDDDVDTPELLVAARTEGVAFVAGPDFMLDGGEASLRLSFASVPPDRISEGVARIAAALDHIRQSAGAA